MMNALPGVNMYFIIDENHLSDNNVAVFLAGSQDYSITRNEISILNRWIEPCRGSFFRCQSKKRYHKNNLITDSTQGIIIEYSINVSVEGNLLHRNTHGLSFHICSFTSVRGTRFSRTSKQPPINGQSIHSQLFQTKSPDSMRISGINPKKHHTRSSVHGASSDTRFSLNSPGDL